MENFTFYSPTYFAFGEGEEQHTGALVRRFGGTRALLVTGGDTLMQCMNCMGIHEIEPLCEVEAGVVLSRFQYQGVSRYVISKSGGFGKADLLISLSCMLSEQVSA